MGYYMKRIENNTILIKLKVSGVLDWMVVGKVTEYGQNVTLFCNVSNCCPKDAAVSTAPPNVPTGNSKLSQGEIASIITGIAMVIVLVVILIYFWIRKIKASCILNAYEFKLKILDTNKLDKELPETIPLVDNEGLSDLKEKVVKLENEQTEVIPKNIRGIL
ncbi:unnamed protein product [Mytilus edulis]|uniref:Uncharacterized protein n=1 Tax=Mytilus edulis TaxID=6550 RepID=A0A8S3RRT7_MYTED|nr:unnamed protein product [Mytilus edulis]